MMSQILSFQHVINTKNHGIFTFFFQALSYFFNPHLRICVLTLEREEGRERKRERKRINVRDKHQSVCPLTGDRTYNPLVRWAALQPTEPTGQGSSRYFTLI